MTIAHQHRTSSGQDGFALITVLWVVVIMSFLVLAFTTSVRTGIAVTRTEGELARLQAIADAGLELAAARLHDTAKTRWRPDGRTYQVAYGGAALQIIIQDTNGLLDINFAPSEQLLPALQRAAGSAGIGQALHDFILARREAAKGQSAGWGETPAPTSSPGRTASREPNSAAPIPTNMPAPFKHLTALLEVPGMTPKTLARLENILTVHSAGKGVNIRTAPIALLRVLPQLTPQQARRLQNLRASSSSRRELDAFIQSIAGNFTKDSGPAYTVRIAVQGTAFAEPLQAAATILIDKDRPAPSYGIEWRPLGS